MTAAETHSIDLAELPNVSRAILPGDRELFVLGTAHVSKASVEEVERAVALLDPDTICVELCATRLQAMEDRSQWQSLDIFKVIREGKTLLLLANLALAAYQRRIGEELGVKPGAELMAAVGAARARDTRLCLIDREIQTTLKRTWANLSFWNKLSLLGGLAGGVAGDEQIAAEEVEKLKDREHLQGAMEQFAEAMPQVKQPLIDERDLYLIDGARDAPGQRVLAVVGAGHVSGMLEALDSQIDKTALDRIPPPSGWPRLLKWLIPAVLLGAFAFGAGQSEGKTLAEMVFAWILPNSIAAALFAAIARAKPLSIAAAFVSSPITSLNPMLGSGMVVGLLEAWLRKPTVADCERLPEDFHSYAGQLSNPFSHVLVVAVLTNIGSAIGAWIGLTWVVKLL